jgi:hypothetical protein
MFQDVPFPRAIVGTTDGAENTRQFLADLQGHMAERVGFEPHGFRAAASPLLIDSGQHLARALYESVKEHATFSGCLRKKPVPVHPVSLP